MSIDPHHRPFLPLPRVYCMVASICKGIPMSNRFQIIPEISFMSSLPAASRAMRDAIFKPVVHLIFLATNLSARGVNFSLKREMSRKLFALLIHQQGGGRCQDGKRLLYIRVLSWYIPYSI